MKKLLIIFILIPVIILAQSGDNELVNIKELIPDVVLDLRYSTTNNFTSQKLYTTNEALFILKGVIQLKSVADSLRKIKVFDGKSYPEGLGLKIFDAYRPRAIQYLMFEIYPDPVFVADPSSGSIHNYGAAIDLTLVDLATNEELPMPTEFDYFGPEAHHSFNDLPSDVIKNRSLLKSLMTKAGFQLYDAEWWHYQLPEGRSFQILDFQMK